MNRDSQNIELHRVKLAKYLPLGVISLSVAVALKLKSLDQLYVDNFWTNSKCRTDAVFLIGSHDQPMIILAEVHQLVLGIPK